MRFIEMERQTQTAKLLEHLQTYKISLKSDLSPATSNVKKQNSIYAKVIGERLISNEIFRQLSFLTMETYSNKRTKK